MKREIWAWIAVLALFLAIRGVADHGLASGPAPAFSGTTLDGAEFSLERARGKPILVYFWASWCSICRAMQGAVRSVAEDSPVVTLAMQSGDRDEVARYMREQAFQAPVVLDQDGAIAQAYGLRGVPAAFVLDGAGNIRFAGTGYTTEAGLRLRLWLAGLLFP